MCRIVIGNNTINNLLQQMNEICYNLTNINELTIDFDYSDFIRPYKLAVIASFVEFLRREVDFKVKCVNISTTNESYISRMNFFKEIDIEYFEYFNRHDSTGRFIPISRLNRINRSKMAGEVSKIIHTQWEGIHENIIGCLDWAIQEIIDNVFNHSKTPIDGYLTAQYYPNLNQIDLSIIDNGVGIAERLRENPDYAHVDNQTALVLALKKGVTRDLNEGAGAGLYYTKRIIEENQGDLTIFSKDASIRVNAQGTQLFSSPMWEGTIIRIVINTNKIIYPEKVWNDNIPSTVEDFLYHGTLW